MSSLPEPLHPQDLPWRERTGYPPPFAEAVAGRAKKAVSDALGITQFGWHLISLQPGAMSALRHWHHQEDEMVFVLRGCATLVKDSGARELQAGMFAGFPAGVADGHHVVNRSTEEVVLMVVGSRKEEETAEYPDDDLRAHKTKDGFRFTDKEGREY